MASRNRKSEQTTGGGPGFLGWSARLLALVFLVWVAGFVVFVLGQQGPAADIKTEGVAVLTGGPGRVGRGIAVLEADLAQRLLISGVDQSVRPLEFLATTTLSTSLFNCCVDLGYESDTTRSNAREVADWVNKHGFKSIRLVTAGYHMPRAHAELEAVLPHDVVVVRDGVRAGLPFWAMLSEYAKLQAAWLILRVRPSA